MSLKRVSTAFTVVIANGAALSGAFEFTGASGGIVDMPAAWTEAALGFHHCSTRGGTFQPLYKEDGTLVEITLATDPSDLSYLLPADVFPARFLKLWSETAGSGVNQGAARSLIVSVKT